MSNIITFGTFDIFHIGHLNILKKSKNLGTKLIVGVSSDELNIIKKNRKPINNLKQRLAIISSIKYVDQVFIEESLEKKEDYIRLYKADILVMGDDWKNKFDHLPCKVIYLPRTPSISTTQIIESIKKS